jgi:hypothetical protein
MLCLASVRHYLRHHQPGASRRRRNDGRGVFAVLNLATGDLVGTFEQVEARAARSFRNQWSSRPGDDCAFRDPAGNLIRITEVCRANRGKP